MCCMNEIIIHSVKGRVYGELCRSCRVYIIFTLIQLSPKNNIIVTNSESTTMKKQNSVYYRSFGIAFLLLKLYVKDGQFGASLTGYRPCDTSRDMILFRMNK